MMEEYILSHTAAEVDVAIGNALVSRPYIEDTDNDSLDIADKEGNVLVRFANGHVKTKNFDSEGLVGSLENINTILEGLL